MKLRFTLRGAAELAEVLAYIEERSPRGALHVQARIQAIINLLLQYPHAGPLTSEGRLRRVVASPYPYRPSLHQRSISDAMIVANPVHPQAFRIDKTSSVTNSKVSDQRPRRKSPACASSAELAPKAQPPRKRSGPRTARG